ncbi:hypothetical protein RI129_011575 [Pyrocoelia pectoralis]|uniref:Caveolin n=1 Tax=Pyrocoelia pectoralis TaxID=417401 RepID=A0AAN7ZHA1_9COLE
MSRKPSAISDDLEDRDPNNLGAHLQVSWSDVIGEPISIRSPECAWRLSNHCFQISKNVCYIFLSVLCAPITACCLGCSFACIAFEHIWCVNPCLRIWKISCAAIKIFIASCTQAFIAPICDAMGRFWSGIKVRTQTQMYKEETDERDVLLA